MATEATTRSIPHHGDQDKYDGSAQRLSLLHGPVDPPLVDLTLGELLELQTYQHGPEECIVIPWTGARWTYAHLGQQSSALAQALLDMGIGVGDRVGIMAGNCEQYAAVFFAVAKIGAVLVILNNTYTTTEALYGLDFSDCRVFFTTKTIGRLDNGELLARLADRGDGQRVVMLRGDASGGYRSYDELVRAGSRRGGHDRLARATRHVLPHQVVNLQFTSGTTGLPKAAMLTHQYVSPLSPSLSPCVSPDDDAAQQPGQQCALHWRPHAAHARRRSLLPAAPLPLLWARAGAAGRGDAWRQDCLPGRGL